MREWIAGWKYRIIGRFGALGAGELVTIRRLPKRGVAAMHLDRSDMRTIPTPDCTGGIFTVVGRSGRGFRVQNATTRIELTGVPRKSMWMVI